MLLLDTHALLWLDNGDPLSAAAHEAIRQAAPAGGVLVSPVSAWEIGLLVSKGRLGLVSSRLPGSGAFCASPASG